jgi:hypothetical protein
MHLPPPPPHVDLAIDDRAVGMNIPWVEEVTTFGIAQIRFTKLSDTGTTPKTVFFINKGIT